MRFAEIFKTELFSKYGQKAGCYINEIYDIMYYGKETDELKKAREEYEGIFGYDPNGEIELEFNEQDEYLAVLLQCIEEKKDMFNVLRE